MSHKRTKQQGSMILVAVFVIVVMGLLAANLSRIQWSNQDTLSREVLGTQAWFVAQSANEWALVTLFPITNPASSVTLAQLDQRCDSVNSPANNVVNDITDGVPCRINAIRCSKPASSLPDELKYYRVTSSAICRSGTIFEVQREQDVWVRALGE